MKEALKPRIYGWILTGILLISDIIFLCLLAFTSLFTSFIMIICAAVLLVLTAVVLVLVWDSGKKVRTVIGTVLAVILIIIEIIGAYYVNTGAAALKDITNPGVESSEVGVYVRKDDPAKVIEDTKGYTFGILKTQDRETTDAAIRKLSILLGEDVKILVYADIGEMLDGLFISKDVNAILLNTGFLEALIELDEYKLVGDNIRRLHAFHIEIETENEKQESQNNGDTFTMYISGIDTSGSVSRKSRSDVNILATVNIKTGQVLLISTPRDYYVPLSISNGVPDKLTHAGIYGIDVSRDTLEMLYDTEIDYYFRVNFDGFEEIIDALGGITVYSDYGFWTGIYTYKKGENYLNGAEALGFARERYEVPGGDRQRGKNQMAVIKGVIDKAMGPELLTNYKEILDGVKGSFETDMPYQKITALVQNQLKNATQWNVTSYSVDGTGSTQRPYSLSTNAYVMIPNETTVEHAKELMAQVRNGEVPTP